MASIEMSCSGFYKFQMRGGVYPHGSSWRNRMNSKNKVVSLQEAISKYVNDSGIWMAIGGFVTNRRPYALTFEVIRQRKKNLYIETGAGAGDIDMMIGCGMVKVLHNSYVANSGYSQVGRRFKKAVTRNEILIEDFSLDAQTILYHAAALGLDYVCIKNMIGTSMVDKWGISEEIRKNDPNLPDKKLLIHENPFKPGDKLCCLPVPTIDVALVHAHMASPDGTARIIGPVFQDIDIATAAKYCILSCDQLVDNDYLRRNPELNNIPNLVVDAVVHQPYGAYPSQLFGVYDYDGRFFYEYDKASADEKSFFDFVEHYIDSVPDYYGFLEKIGVRRLLEKNIAPGNSFVHELKRK